MSGVYSCQSTNFSQLNHAVQLIGYDSKGNWLIKNQWSTSWGMDGYAYLDVQNSCGVGLAVYTFTQF
jgi:C1A family cysteine protease